MRFALSGVMVVLAVAAIAPRFADSYWRLEFPGHLRAHLAIGALLMTILFVAWQAWRHVGLGVALTALLAAPVLALWVPPSPTDHADVALRVLSLNVSFYSRNYGDVLELIDRLRPDVAGLVEVNTQWIEVLAPLDDVYVHRAVYLRRRGSGVALLSQIPLEDAEVFDAFRGLANTMPSVRCVLGSIASHWPRLTRPTRLRDGHG